MGYVLWKTDQNIGRYGLPGHAQIRKVAVSFHLMGTLGRFPWIPLMELDRETWHVCRYVWFLYSCEVRGDSEQVRLSYLIVYPLFCAHLALGQGIAPWERLEWAGAWVRVLTMTIGAETRSQGVQDGQGSDTGARYWWASWANIAPGIPEAVLWRLTSGNVG